MSFRLHWFQVHPCTQKNIQEFSKKMLRDKYRDELGWGFEIGDVRRDCLTGRFIEREITTDVSADPFGNEQKFERTIFHQVRFSLGVPWPNIEILNAPRKLSVFFTRLGEYSNFNTSITVVRTKPISWVSAIRRNANGVVMLRAMVTGVAVTPAISAQILLSGTEDVEAHLRNFVRAKQFSLDSAVVEFQLHDEPISCDINSFGRIKVLEGKTETSSRFFRELLQEMKNRNEIVSF